MCNFIFRIKRQPSDAKQTLGTAEILKDGKVIYTCKTLELPWKSNATQISCIPTGTYEVSKRHSPKYGNHFHVLNVPKRSYILIHQGNFYKEIQGCILVGKTHADINKDGYRDVTSSVATMSELRVLLPNAFKLEVS